MFEKFYKENRDRLLNEFFNFLRIKSISTDENYKDEIERALEWLENKLANLGFKVKRLLPKNPRRGKAANPVFYAEYVIDKNLPTITIYGHYDVQPADPLDKWNTDPFEPVLKDGKIYARGANDNKGQLFANMVAVEYYVRSIKDKKFNIKFFVEGEEEIGGPTTNEVIESEEFKDLLQSDVFWIADGPWISPDKPTIVYALRGIAYYDLYLKNLPRDIHSGIYGNVVLNPANLTGYVIFKLKDIIRNRIRVPKIYKKVRKPSKQELELVRKASPSYAEIKNEVGARVVTRYRRKGEEFPPLVLTGLMPSLDVHGVYAGFVEPGQAKTIIPAEARIKFSVRLVPHLTKEYVTEQLNKYLADIIPNGVDWELKPLEGAEPFVMDPGRPELQKLLKIMSQAFEKEAVIIPEGGTIGLVATYSKHFDAAILMPNYGLPDDGLHSPNEKFNESQIIGGAKTILGYLES